MTENEALSAKALTLISHKLRTPLSIINGYSEAILSQAGKEKFSPFTTKALGEIHKQGSRMSLLIDKLMAFNKVLTADDKTIEKQSVNIKNLIKACAEQTIAREGTEKGIPAEQTGGVKRGTFIEIDCSTQLALNANEEMLKLCVCELLSNAIKFNNKFSSAELSDLFFERKSFISSLQI